MLRPALDLVITALEEIRESAERMPCASRATLTRLLSATEQRTSIAPDSVDRLAPVRARVNACMRCPHLVRTRTQTVFGVGNPEAELMFVGEAPGADEDVQGEPFVGRAGQLLTRIIEAMGLSREKVYI